MLCHNKKCNKIIKNLKNYQILKCLKFLQKRNQKRERGDEEATI